MMKGEIYHYIPEEETFANRLNARLEECKQAIIASAFFTNGAFQEVKPSLELALESGAKITFLLGRFDFVTEPRAVKGLLGLASKYPKQLFVYFDGDFYFHYKLARFKTHYANAVFIGSSNLTPKGLASTGEVNLEIVNNTNVFKQTGKILNERIQVALKAKTFLDEYQSKFDQAKKYRRQRRRWENLGQSKLAGKRKVKQNRSEPAGEKFELCWINYEEHDTVLKKNVQKTYEQKISRDVFFPNQWVHLNSKMEASHYLEGMTFAIVDDVEYCIGFAKCTKNIWVMGRNEKEEAIIFYKYLPGWRAPFTKDTYDSAKKEVGFRLDTGKIGKTLAAKLKAFLKDHRKQLQKLHSK